MHLGIDFGTSYTKLGYWSENGFVNLAGNGKHIPSAAAYASVSGELYFGDLALRLDEPDISRCLFFKLALKRDLTFHLGPYPLDEILKQFLRFLNREYAESKRLEIESITLSVPNYFGLQARNILIEAARKAFSVPEVMIMPEPAAALLGYNQTAACPLYGSILIIDIGGGTTDFSFLEISDRDTELIVETQFQIGNDAFSGSEVDRNILRNLFLPHFTIDTGTLIPNRYYDEILTSPRDRQMLTGWMMAAEEAKIRLSRQNLVNVHIPDFYAGRSISMLLSREMLEWQLAGVFERLETYCRQTVREKAQRLGLASGDAWLLDAILLVGGGARMHAVQKVVAECFPGVDLVVPKDSENLVASGVSGHYSRSLLGQASVKTIYPFEFYQQLFDGHRSEFYLKIIPFDTSNLELDMNRSYKISTVTPSELIQEADRNEFRLCIYEAPQGEKERIKQRFTGLEPVLNISWPEESVPDVIDVFLNMADAVLEINSPVQKESNINRSSSKFHDLIAQKRASLEAVKAYPYINPELISDYAACLQEMETLPLSSADDYSKVMQFQLLMLLQILNNRKV